MVEEKNNPNEPKNSGVARKFDTYLTSKIC